MTAAPQFTRRAAPGWKMTPEQRSLYWRLWAAACEYQGWDRLSAVERDEKRHQVLAGCGFASAKDIDRTDGFDAVKKRLEELVDIVHNEPPDAGLRRRILSRVNRALWQLRQAEYPEHSIQTILLERFKVIEGSTTIPDLPTHELVNLSKTLAARLATQKERQAQSIRPAPSSVGNAASCNAAGTAYASAVKPLFSPIAADFQDSFFHGG
jgi:hypothetical protein